MSIKSKDKIKETKAIFTLPAVTGASRIFKLTTLSHQK